MHCPSRALKGELEEWQFFRTLETKSKSWSLCLVTSPELLFFPSWTCLCCGDGFADLSVNRISVLANTQRSCTLLNSDITPVLHFSAVQDLCECLAQAFCFVFFSRKAEPYRFPHHKLWELSILLSIVEELWADNEGLQTFPLLADRMSKHSN